MQEKSRGVPFLSRSRVGVLWQAKSLACSSAVGEGCKAISLVSNGKMPSATTFSGISAGIVNGSFVKRFSFTGLSGGIYGAPGLTAVADLPYVSISG
jgi:hypothetical protein